MSLTTAPFLISIFVFTAVSSALLLLWPDVLPPLPEAGERGVRRKQALERYSLFQRLEPVLRPLSQTAAKHPWPELHRRAAAAAQKAGYPFGIDGSDLTTLSAVCAVLGALLFAALAVELDRAVQAGILIGALFGAAAPWFKMQDAAKHRFLSVCRGLPGVVDLISLSMESGLDFMNAMRQTADRLSPESPLRFELEHMLHKMKLGRPRSDVLLSFSERIPAPTVQQFTAAVNQAEMRGTPLAEVLAVQAKVQRSKRSQAAEQAAARAAVMLIAPLMLIFACVFIIIMGPFIVKFIRGDLF